MTEKVRLFRTQVIYETPEELMDAVEKFLNTREPAIVDGQEVMPLLTITGLCIGLGFASRQSLYDYAKKPDFKFAISQIRLLVERGYEENLHRPNATGSIFALKNMGWSDKTEIDHSSSDGSMSPRGMNDFYADIEGDD